MLSVCTTSFRYWLRFEASKIYPTTAPHCELFFNCQAALHKRFGANVRRERVRRHLTQEQLAEQVGFYPRTVQKIEAGTINVPLTTLARVQAALGCDWVELLGR